MIRVLVRTGGVAIVAALTVAVACALGFAIGYAR